MNHFRREEGYRLAFKMVYSWSYFPNSSSRKLFLKWLILEAIFDPKVKFNFQW